MGSPTEGRQGSSPAGEWSSLPWGVSDGPPDLGGVHCPRQWSQACCGHESALTLPTPSLDWVLATAAPPWKKGLLGTVSPPRKPPFLGNMLSFATDRKGVSCHSRDGQPQARSS